MADQTRTYSGPFLEGSVALPDRMLPFTRGVPVVVSSDEADVLDLLPEWGGSPAGPDATVADVLADVGDDPALAAEALAAEQARPKPRKTLVDALTALTATEPDTGDTEEITP